VCGVWLLKLAFPLHVHFIVNPLLFRFYYVVTVQAEQPGALLITITLEKMGYPIHRQRCDRVHLTPHVLQPGPSPYMSACMF
jgi:hypothetical protein